MRFLATIRKQGNSFIVTVNKEYIKAYDIKEDDQIELDIVKIVKETIKE